MIMIFDLNKKELMSFEDDEGLFKYINTRESHKRLEDYAYFSKDYWRFLIFMPKEVQALYHNLKKERVTETLTKAYGCQLGLVEIYEGDFDNPTQIPSTPDLDLKKLKKEWLLNYCQAHGWLFVEHHNHNDNPVSSNSIH